MRKSSGDKNVANKVLDLESERHRRETGSPSKVKKNQIISSSVEYHDDEISESPLKIDGYNEEEDLENGRENNDKESGGDK